MGVQDNNKTGALPFSVLSCGCYDIRAHAQGGGDESISYTRMKSKSRNFVRGMQKAKSLHAHAFCGDEGVTLKEHQL